MTTDERRQASIERAREEAREIAETLFAGDYDATEGLDGSRDTTWTDFGIVCGTVDLLASALADAERQLDEARESSHSFWKLASKMWEKRALAAEAALADTRARNRDLLDAIEDIADATAYAAGNILRPPRED